MTPEQVIEEVKASNISGRGGAAFPAGRKWEAARASRDRPKYVICNGEEGEPAIYKDRRMLEADPHRVIEGVLINGYAIGAEHAYIYVGGEHYVAIDRLTKALEDAEGGRARREEHPRHRLLDGHPDTGRAPARTPSASRRRSCPRSRAGAASRGRSSSAPPSGASGRSRPA